MKNVLNEDKIDKQVNKYQNKAVSTKRSNKKAAEVAAVKLYKQLGMGKPKIVWVKNPKEGVIAAAKVANNTDNPTNSQIRKQINKMTYPSLDFPDLACCDYLVKEGVVKTFVADMNVLADNCFAYWSFQDVVIMSEKPTKIGKKSGEVVSIEFNGGWKAKKGAK